MSSDRAAAQAAASAAEAAKTEAASHPYRPRDFWPCPTCGGTGQMRHRLWGSSSCPHPTEDCEDCGGTGGASSHDLRDDYETEQILDEMRGLA